MVTGEERLTKARIKLQSRNPFFSYLSLFVKFRKAKEGEIPEHAGMGVSPDGLLIYKEEFVEKLTDEEVIGVLCHELCHLALLHLIRRGSREKTAWNIACDLATNSMLVQNRFELPKGTLVPIGYEQSFDIQGKNKKVTIEKINEKTAEQIYEEIPELNEGEEYEGSNGECGFDKHSEGSNGKPQSKEKQNELENEWKNRLEEAYIGAKQRGNVPNGLERYIDNLKKSQVNWKALLRKYIQATIPNDYTWAKRGKKSRATKTYLPSVVKEKIDVCIAIDVSGSIGKEELTDFVSEIIGMAKAYQSCISMTLITHECEVRDRWEIRNGNINEIKKIKIKGGGGTSFNPVVKYINEKIKGNKAIIWLTDGYAEKIEEKTNYPIIWLLTKGGTDEVMKDRKQDIIVWLKKTYD